MRELRRAAPGDIAKFSGQEVEPPGTCAKSDRNSQRPPTMEAAGEQDDLSSREDQVEMEVTPTDPDEATLV